MEAFEIWGQAMKALPKALSADFGKPRILLTDDKQRGIIYWGIKNTAVEYKLVLFPQVTHNLIPLLQQLAAANEMHSRKKTFLMTKVIYPKIGEKLIEADINFVDAAGNMFINQNGIYLMRLGSKAKETEKSETKGRLFGETGLKLLFGILQHPDFINLSYREMADAVNISAASVTILLKEMLASKYLHEGNNKKRIVDNKLELLQRWAVAYNEILKPKIKIGEYTTKASNLLKTYKQIMPQKWEGLWSGEAAANKYTNYLSPGKLSMFVTGKDKKWMSELKLLPVEENGTLEVFNFFWNRNHIIFNDIIRLPDAVPPLLIYAELITSNDGRNIETAQKILNEHIQLSNE